MVNIKILNSRDEWLENRFNGIGGSEISAAVGLNPYLDNVTLWEYKTKRKLPEDISDKSYVEYGTKAEEHLRALFALDFPDYKVDYIENNSFSNDKYPFALASVDGLLTDPNGRKGILEIKTSEILNSQHKEKWSGENIPQNYYCQVLFYMAVLEADFCILKAQLKTSFLNVPYLQTRHYFIEADEVKEDINYLMQKGAEFWEYVKNDEKPPRVLPPL